MSITAADLAKMEFDYYELTKPWDKIIGKPEKNGSIMMYSPAGSGKSTVALLMCHEFARHEKVLFVPAEEGISKTLQDKVKRIGLGSSPIEFHDWKGHEDLKKYLLGHKIKVLCIDSYTIIDERLASFEAFRLWCKENDIFFITIVQQTKDGKFMGKSTAGFNVDCKIQVFGGKPSTIATGKNRFGDLYEHDKDLTKTKAPEVKKPGQAKTRKARRNPGKDTDQIEANMNEIEALLNG